jgi:hypothetical protein
MLDFCAKHLSSALVAADCNRSNKKTQFILQSHSWLLQVLWCQTPLKPFQR